MQKDIHDLSGFKPTIPVFQRAETFHALDRAATVISDNDDSIQFNSIQFYIIYVPSQ
jgi:hypothetical protein